MNQRESYIFDGYLGSARLLEAQVRAGLVFPRQMAEYVAKHPSRPEPVPVKRRPVVVRPMVPANIVPPARRLGRRVIEHVANRTGLSVTDILGRRRRVDIVAARCRVSRIMRRLGCSWSEIGRALERDHSTIIHYLKHKEIVG